MTPLSRILKAERHQQRTSPKARGDLFGASLSVPYISELKIAEPVEPLLATNMRGQFLVTRKSKQDDVRFGFSEVPLDKEPVLLRALIHQIAAQKWGNVASSYQEGLQRLVERAVDPKFLIASKHSFQDPEEAKKAIGAEVEILLTDLPEGEGLVTGLPDVVGMYTRVGDHLGILIQNANRTVVSIVPQGV